MEPLTFEPIYMERVWGGRELERVYGRNLPDPEITYGEAWELVDREEAQSMVNGGPLAGKTLHELWTNHREKIFGRGLPHAPRFPILLKILDARDDLSIQVHPPAAVAPQLGGEPKTEMWFIADCETGAQLYIGLKPGITRVAFETAIADGSVANAVHAVQPKRGDSIFIPSGRLHAIGAGFLIHEIQQNSDTTYRVFDWNRPGVDGKPRQLHVAESLASIDFNDFAPEMDVPDGGNLARCPHFSVDRIGLAEGEFLTIPRADRFAIVSMVSGMLRSKDGRKFNGGDTVLLPANAELLTAEADSVVLLITLPG